jgi:hypothetical protein
MRPSLPLLLALVLATGSTGCAAAQTKVGAVMFFAGLGGLAGGIGVTAGGCSPSPDFCKSIAPGRMDVGVPILAASTLALIAGGALVLSAKGEHAEPTPRSPAPAPPPPAPRRTSEWISPL